MVHKHLAFVTIFDPAEAPLKLAFLPHIYMLGFFSAFTAVYRKLFVFRKKISSVHPLAQLNKTVTYPYGLWATVRIQGVNVVCPLGIT